MSGTLSLHTEGVPWWAFTRDPDEESEVGKGSCQKEAGPIAITVSEEVPGESCVGTPLRAGLVLVALFCGRCEEEVDQRSGFR